MRLREGADVLIHNFKPGTLEKWGIGYADTLAKKFPRLVYCHITGFGPDGPRGGLPGYDAAVQAVSGLMSINGTPESGPVRMGTPIVDLGTGLNAAIGILMALFERSRTGKGQAVDCSPVRLRHLAAPSAGRELPDVGQAAAAHWQRASEHFAL